MEENEKIRDKILLVSGTIGTAEYRLLHACIADSKWLDDTRLSEDIFFHTVAKTIFKSLLHLKELNVPATVYSILQEVIDKGNNISKETLVAIADYKEDNVQNIDDILFSLNKARHQYQLSLTLGEMANQINIYDAPIEKLNQQLFDLQDSFEYLLTGKDTRILSYQEWLEQYKKDYLQRMDVSRYRFNDAIFDDMIINGASPGDIGIIFSTTGQGKTTLMTHLFNNFIAGKIPTMLFELEMNGNDMMDRKLAAQYQVEFAKLAHPTEESFIENESYINKELETAYSKVLGFTDHPYYDLAGIRDEVIKFQKRIGQQYCIVLIDLLSLVKDFCTPKNGVNLAQSIELAMNQLSRIAKELQIHVIGTVQAGRSADKMDIKDYNDIQYCKGTLNDLKNSNAFAERARYVINIFRPQYYALRYLPNDPLTKINPDVAVVSILKQNNGPTGFREYMCNMEKFHLFPISKQNNVLIGETDNSQDWEQVMKE